MTEKPDIRRNNLLHISRSHTSSRINKTGSWRYLQPVFSGGIASCRAACPVGTDIAEMIRLSSQGLYQEALTGVLNENPLPAVCGYVCDHPCEASCNRSQLDAPLAINAMERFVGLQGVSTSNIADIPIKTSNRRSVAVIGSGPSGLSAAYFLGRLGYQCDVFESEAEPGGLLRWGIPSYRLPIDVLEQEITRIQDLGVSIHCNQAVAADFLESARKQYQAIFVGCGLGRPVPMQIPGEMHMLDGLALLKTIRQGDRTPMDGVSAVVGGGNAAIDVARTLIRLGSPVIVLYRRRITDMPAFDNEVAAALDEGAQIKELTIPVNIESQADQLRVHLQRMAVTDHSLNHGRPSVEPIPGETETMQATRVVRAIGAEADMVWQPFENQRSIRLSLSHCALTGDEFPIVYGGDIVNRKLRVSDAIASGKQAAIAIDLVLQKNSPDIESDMIGNQLGPGSAISFARYMDAGEHQPAASRIVTYEDINPAYFLPAMRLDPETEGSDHEGLSFAAQQSNFTFQNAADEAGRCFSCGVCTDCDNCSLFCPEIAVVSDHKRRIDLDYCKGCGVCVEECPRSAMILQETGYETGS